MFIYHFSTEFENHSLSPHFPQNWDNGDMNTPRNIFREYEEAYDQHTVELCYNQLRPFSIGVRANIIEVLLGTNIQYTEYPKGELDKILIKLLIIEEIKKSRREEKNETIKQWMVKAAHNQRRLHEHTPMHTIRCKKCNARTIVEESFLDENDEHILTFYRCKKGCLPMQLLYPDGTPYNIQRSVCDNCYFDMKSEITRENNIEVLKKVCYHCGYYEILETKNLLPKSEGELIWLEKMREAFCGL